MSVLCKVGLPCYKYAAHYCICSKLQYIILYIAMRHNNWMRAAAIHNTQSCLNVLLIVEAFMAHIICSIYLDMMRKGCIDAINNS